MEVTGIIFNGRVLVWSAPTCRRFRRGVSTDIRNQSGDKSPHSQIYLFLRTSLTRLQPDFTYHQTNLILIGPNLISPAANLILIGPNLAFPRRNLVWIGPN